MKTISILGCGWLGLALAKSLISKNYLVKGATTTPAKLSTLEVLGIEPYLVQFLSSEISSNLSGFIDTDLLIIAIPPGIRSNNDQDNYRDMAKQLVKLLPGSLVKKLILISSISVYGSTNSVMNESNQPQPDTDSGRLLAEVENQFMQIKDVEVIVLRLAGLIGPGRSASKFFADKTNIPNGLAPVNLIHLDDAISLICNLIKNSQTHGIYNGCAPDHPTKKDFYTLAAKKAGLILPEFLTEKKEWKIVNSERLQKELKFEFKYADWMDYAMITTKKRTKF
jgi:nucleoside-diphosphate-sugar epimerase